MQFREFTSKAELIAHYREVAKRTPPREDRRPEPPAPLPEVKEVVVVEPTPIPVKKMVLPPARTHVDRIIQVVCQHFMTTPGELRSQTRSARIIKPRHIAIYLVKEASGWSLPQIGLRFGERDHTTILHAIRRIEYQIKTNPEVAHLVAQLRERANPPEQVKSERPKLPDDIEVARLIAELRERSMEK